MGSSGGPPSKASRQRYQSGGRSHAGSISIATPSGTSLRSASRTRADSSAFTLRRMSWFERVPKVELHVHLEGAIPLPTLWALIEKYGGDPAVPDLAALEARFAYRDFPHFIETWVWKSRFLREYDDFTLIAAAVAADLARQAVRYAEVFYSPPDFARQGLAPQRLTAA